MNELGTTLVFGGQAGSEGKGAIVGYLARKYDWDAAICSFMTNAGHTWLGDNGEKVVVQQLPMALVSRSIPILMIGAGSAITLPQLAAELEEFDKAGYRVSDRLRIHPRAMIIEESDAAYEHIETRNVASTAKGCGRALARKVMRSKDVRLARDIPWLKDFIVDTSKWANLILNRGGNVLIEGSQGFDLDPNHGIEYPYCTSRGTTPQQTLADCGISGTWVKSIIATIRSYPIRVGNIVENGVEIGNSGPFGGKELTWEEITARSGSPEPLEERTTVTKRVRRIFEIDVLRLKTMVDICMPTHLALTFADYIDWTVKDKSYIDMALHPKIEEFVRSVEESTGVNVEWIKTGAKDSALYDINDAVASLAYFED